MFEDSSVVEVVVDVGTDLVEVEVVLGLNADLVEEDVHKHGTPPFLKICLLNREVRPRVFD